MLRRQGLPGVPFEEHVRTMDAEPEAVDPTMPLLIVDDMFTQGTTLRASAAVLRKAGYSGEFLGATAGYLLASPDVSSPLIHAHFTV